ncbi:MAG: ferritin-like domain-containing protein [Egibacteraceae bacterium]
MRRPTPVPALFGGRPVITFSEEVDRRRFLRGAAIIGVGGTLAVTTARDPVALAQTPMGDLEILNYALTLEYLESDFYAQGLQGGILQGREMELIEPIGQHEAAHVTALTDTITQLGGMPVARPTFTYPPNTFTDRAAFLMTASTFEELGVTAYHGQVANIDNIDILAAAAAIAGSESRHAAILADLTGGNPFPAPVEAMRTMEEVLGIAMPFIAQGS